MLCVCDGDVMDVVFCLQGSHRNLIMNFHDLSMTFP